MVDMYRDHEFKGEVQSLSGGAGQAFSLLPAQNATGNWVKVTQRVPVRVRVLDPDPQLSAAHRHHGRRCTSRAPDWSRMYQNILLCYDGTAEGRRALRQGAEVAMAMKSRAYLLAICRNLLSTAVPEGVTPELVHCEEGHRPRAARPKACSGSRITACPPTASWCIGNPDGAHP